MKRKRKKPYTIIRTKYKQNLSSYLAHVIATNYRKLGNKGMKSYNSYYHLCSNIKLNNQELESIYQKVDKLLEIKYKLILAHPSRTDKLYLVNLRENTNE
jgi:hypothetical protein